MPSETSAGDRTQSFPRDDKFVMMRIVCLLMLKGLVNLLLYFNLFSDIDNISH